jgi:mannose-6-phosphate isomerase class I
MLAQIEELVPKIKAEEDKITRLSQQEMIPDSKPSSELIVAQRYFEAMHATRQALEIKLKEKGIM